MTSLFNTLLENFVYILVSLLPSSTGLPSNVSDAILTFVAYLNGLNLILPISDLFAILALYVTFEVAVFLWHFIKLIGNWVRGAGA